MAERNNSGRNNPRSRGKTGKKPVWLIFWLFFFIIIICLFVVNWENIRNNIRQTGVRERIFNQPAAEQQDPQPPPVTAPETAPDAVQPPADRTAGPAAGPAPSGDAETEGQPGPAGTPLEPAAGQLPTDQPSIDQLPTGQSPTPPAGQLPTGQPPAPPTDQPPTGQSPTPPAGQLPTGQPSTPPAGQPPTGQSSTGQSSTPLVGRPSGASAEEGRRERGIYFMQVDRDGSILRTRVTRSLAVSDSPMIDVLRALLQGPSAEEQQRGLISLIPPGTRIVSRTTTVRGNTAYIDFSEDFMFNTYGVEGYAAQLRQIVWTVTEFSNINDVQILIEGRRVDYLGEGIWIGSPIGRDTP